MKTVNIFEIAFFVTCLSIPIAENAFAQPMNPTSCSKITQKDLNLQGYTISSPGCYILSQNIVFNPKNTTNNNAITIAASNVSLNLNGKTISGNISGPSQIGIFGNNVGNISVSNGSIRNLSGVGIEIQNSNNITLTSLNISGTGLPSAYGGLDIHDSADIVIDHVKAFHNFGTGMYLHGVVRTAVTNSNFDDNVGGNAAPQFFFGDGLVGDGALVESTPTTQTQTISFKNCTFNRNSGGGEGSGMEIGPWSLLPVQDVTVVGCQFLNNFMTGATTIFNDSSGLVLVNVDGFSIKDSIASGQRHPGEPGPNYAVSGATGFSINVVKNGTIARCIANDNVGQGSTSIGLRLRVASNVTVQNCSASGNINTASGEAFGFYSDSNGIGPNFGVPDLAANVFFQSNFAQKNTSASGLAGGFKMGDLSGSSVTSNFSIDNPIGILVTDSNAPTLALNNSFVGNIAWTNTVSGIADQVAGSNNFYNQNAGVLNGQTKTTNFVTLPAGTPILLWSISAQGFPNLLNLFKSNTNLSVVP